VSKINKFESEKKNYLVNEEINFEEILLIDEGEKKYMSSKDAIEIARAKNLDLLCVSPSSVPPVCKIIDYKKYIFHLNKSKKKRKESTIKEVRVSYEIGENDLNTKMNKIFS
jgi:translation initiation factor IF-3